MVWESLDTKEATWVWRIPKNNNESLTTGKEGLRLKIEEIQDVIKLVKEDKKQNYIRKQVANFKRIYHNYEEGGFDIWKNELEELIQS